MICALAVVGSIVTIFVILAIFTATVGGRSFDDTSEMVAYLKDQGIRCSNVTDADIAPEVGIDQVMCRIGTDALILTTYPNSEARVLTLRAYRTVERDKPVYVVTGGNWSVANISDRSHADVIRQALGGVVDTWEPGATPTT